MGESLQKMEKIGAVIAIIGCAVAIFDYTDTVKMPKEMMGSIKNLTTHGPNMSHIYDSQDSDNL